MRYEAFEYLWPPRPATAQSPAMLKLYSRLGYVCQSKKNGTCNFIAISPDKEIITMNRHNQPHKAWQPRAEFMQPFLNLPGTGWYVFIAELLHNKVSEGPRNVNYVFDILVDDGEYLVGTTQQVRNAILHSLLPTSVADEEKTIVDDHVWVAKNRIGNFKEIFNSVLSLPENEGIVLKDPTAVLQPCSRQASNSDWQVKVRRPHKNYNS